MRNVSDARVAHNVLRSLRVDRKISQSTLSVAARVSPATISRIEKDMYLPGSEVQAKIATALECRVVDIWPQGDII